jgi:hypothetical protein
MDASTQTQVKGLHYTVRLVAESKPRFLLWKEGFSQPDFFAREPGTHRLLVADTPADLLKQAARWDCAVADQAPAIFDISAMLRALAGLRDGRGCSTTTCKQLLDGWNLLEDLARSLDLAMDKGSVRDQKMRGKAYQKLFWGNNLPSVTPEGRTYLPLFDAHERRLMRRHLRGMWSSVAARAGLCGSPLIA